LKKLKIMSLTVARSERVRGVLTHASCTKIYALNFSSVRVSNTFFIVSNITLIVNKKNAHCMFKTIQDLRFSAFLK